MVLALNLNKALGGGQKGKKAVRGHMPTKRSINLAIVDKKTFKVGLAVPTIALVLIAAAAFSKFLVIDRMAEVAAAQGKVSQLKNEINAGYEELADYDDLALLYAHYTFSGMTTEELQRTDRTEVLALLERVTLPDTGIGSWTLTGNQLVLNMTGTTLQDINLVVQNLMADDLVDYCTVTTASSREWEDRTVEDEEPEYGTTVTARVMVYLVAATEVRDQ